MQVTVPNYSKILSNNTVYVYQLDNKKGSFVFHLESVKDEQEWWKIGYVGFNRTPNRQYALLPASTKDRDSRFREIVDSDLEDIYGVHWEGEDAFSHPTDSVGYVGGDSLSWWQGTKSLPKQECAKKATLRDIQQAIGQGVIVDNRMVITVPSREYMGKMLDLVLYETEDCFITVLHNSLYPAFYRKQIWPENADKINLELWRIAEVLEDLSLD